MRGRGGRSYGPSYGPPPPPPGEYGAHADSPVVMAYGLDPAKMNADRVFNIFCLYGNVERVSICSVLRSLDHNKKYTPANFYILYFNKKSLNYYFF